MFNLPLESFFFFFFSFIAVVVSLLAVTTKKLIHSAVYLMIALCVSAAFYLLLGSEFLAGVQLLLYVGGVLILVVFAIMVTSTNELEQFPAAPTRKIAAAIGAIGFFICCLYVFSDDFFKRSEQMLVKDEIKAIGESFLNYQAGGQIISFELISIILLAALVGGIVIGRKDDAK